MWFDAQERIFLQCPLIHGGANVLLPISEGFLDLRIAKPIQKGKERLQQAWTAHHQITQMTTTKKVIDQSLGLSYAFADT